MAVIIITKIIVQLKTESPKQSRLSKTHRFDDKKGYTKMGGKANVSRQFTLPSKNHPPSSPHLQNPEKKRKSPANLSPSLNNNTQQCQPKLLESNFNPPKNPNNPLIMSNHYHPLLRFISPLKPHNFPFVDLHVDLFNLSLQKQ